MKEITRIHLAKTAYDIELKAKKDLETYLKYIEQIMGSDDAMREIEARMVELLSERGVAAGGVITDADVADLRAKMGEPKEFIDGDEPPVAEVKPSDDKPNKTLMRDPDGAVIGGVCAGIAAYWGINPLWVRLLFVVSPFITFGTSLLIYIVLWISMPLAKTAADKLQMRGEEVTFDSLKQFTTSDEINPKSKHVVLKIVQTGLVIMLFMIALGLLVALMVGMFLGFSVVSWLEGFRVHTWAMGLLVSLILGGAAAVTLFGILTTCAIKWKIGRAAVISIIITMVLGAMSLASIVVFSGVSMQEFAKDRIERVKTVNIEIPKNSGGVKYVDFDNIIGGRINQADHSKIEMKYLAFKDAKAPEVTAKIEGDTLKITNNGDQPRYCANLPVIIADECRSFMWIEVFGPFERKDNPVVDYEWR